MMARLIALVCVAACSSKGNDSLERAIETLGHSNLLSRRGAALSIASSCCVHSSRGGGLDPRACNVTRWILSNAADPALIQGVTTVRATAECQMTIPGELAVTALRRLPPRATEARSTVIGYLEQLEPTEEIIRELLDQLRHPQGTEVLGRAARALADLGEADLAVVAMSLGDSSPTVRRGVLHALSGAAEDRLDLPMLEPILEHSIRDPELQFFARNALDAFRRSARQTEAEAVKKLLAGHSIERLARRRVTCGNLEVIKHLTWLARRDDTGERARQALRHRKRYCPHE
jgi:hypothetical protein